MQDQVVSVLCHLLAPLLPLVSQDLLHIAICLGRLEQGFAGNISRLLQISLDRNSTANQTLPTAVTTERYMAFT
jgi:hypothetical protein